MTLFRYLLRTLALYTGATLFVLLVLYLLFDLIEAYRVLDRGGGGLPVVLGYVRDRAAGALWHVLPAALLGGVTLALGALGRRGELVALSAAGVHPARLLAPVLLVATLCSLCGFSIAQLWLPEANRRIHALFQSVLSGGGEISGGAGGSHRSTPQLAEDRWLRAGNVFVYLGEPGETVADARAVTVLELGPDFRPTRRIDAERLRWQGGRWQLEDAVVRTFQPPAPPTRAALLPAPFEAPPEHLRADLTRPDLLGNTELAALAAWKRAEHQDAAPFEAALAERRSWPLLPWLLALVATPIALRPRRHSGATATLGRAFAIAAAFALLVFIAQSLGRAGALEARWVAWLPIGLCALAGVGLTGSLLAGRGR